MLDKVTMIQQWYRGLREMWIQRSVFGKKMKSVILVQRFIRNLYQASFSTKLKELNAHFEYFELMKVNLQTDSQIKIAKAWKNFSQVKQAKIEVERRR